MRLLWSLPKAAPALLRHLSAYLDLAGLDLSQARREIGAGVAAGVVLAVCALFTLFLACMLVIAFTWDTAYRIAAIAAMAGVFLAASIIAALYRSSLARKRSEFLSGVQEQWRQDRELLERILSDEER